MGVKAKLEQELRRALREGRTEDAEVLKQNIADLQKARGDAAYERALSKKTYTIKSGDSPFSVAEKLYGDDRYAVDLLNANPGVYTFQPGMVIHAPDFNGPAPSLSEEQFAQLQDWGQPGAEDLSLPGYETPDLGPAPEAGVTLGGGTPETAQPSAAEAAAAPEPAMTPEYEAKLNQTADAVVALMQKLGLLEGPGAQAGLEAQPAIAPGGSGVQARPAAQGDGGEEPMPILTSEIQRVERERRAAEERGDLEKSEQLEKKLEDYVELRGGKLSKEETIPSTQPTPVHSDAILSSDPNSYYLQLHGSPLNYPESIGEFPFVSRFEWDARDLNPGQGDDAEGFFGSDNNNGYMVYSEPIENVYHTIIIHDTGVSREDYPGTDIEMVQSTQQFHQAAPVLDSQGNPDISTGYNDADIAYHFVITPDGTIFEARDLRARGTHIQPVKDSSGNFIAGNTGTLGIALIGDDEYEKPTDEQIAALEALVSYLLEQLPRVKCVAGHGTVNSEARGTEGIEVAETVAEAQPSLHYGNCYPGGQ